MRVGAGGAAAGGGAAAVMGMLYAARLAIDGGTYGSLATILRTGDFSGAKPPTDCWLLTQGRPQNCQTTIPEQTAAGHEANMVGPTW